MTHSLICSPANQEPHNFRFLILLTFSAHLSPPPLSWPAADVNSHDYDGRSALHLAASEGKLGAVQLLLERGARVNPLDRWGGTVRPARTRAQNP